ncbi:hypothetical protein A7X60_17725 [Stenotrophomonas maltophilia]|nr:hypothetical protein A7X60_17725 [Stenotrophomonas maltophilia]
MEIADRRRSQTPELMVEQYIFRGARIFCISVGEGSRSSLDQDAAAIPLEPEILLGESAAELIKPSSRCQPGVIQ